MDQCERQMPHGLARLASRSLTCGDRSAGRRRCVLADGHVTFGASSAWCLGSFVAMLVVLLGGLVLGVIRIHTVVSASMEPTLHCANGPGCQSLNSDRVIASSLPYLFDRPRRGDIVLIALRQPKRACNASLAVKRIIALPGDIVAQIRGRVRVNGQALYEPYRADRADRSGLNRDFGPIVSDGFFVMGDNRERSCDSRRFGAVSRDEVVAKVLFSF